MEFQRFGEHPQRFGLGISERGNAGLLVSGGDRAVVLVDRVPPPSWSSSASASIRNASDLVSPKEATPVSLSLAVIEPSSSWMNSTPFSPESPRDVLAMYS